MIFLINRVSLDQQSQENIPEGMIPREVVARNRNRYISNETAKKREAQSDQEVANTSDTMDNDSDDGYAPEMFILLNDCNEIVKRTIT